MWRPILYLLCSIAALVALNPCWGQNDRPTVGLVLTGGGARGAAHVGVIQALEESHIPIDFVVGTSVGALVGGYYAAGWRPEAMKELLSTLEFQSRVTGKPLDPYDFSTDFGAPGIFSIHLGIAQSGVKGHLISSLPLDWALMQELSPASSAAGANFDSLMVPFRCVGSDVLAKTDTVFSHGYLPEKIRASISFPFYMRPVWMEGRPIYDGGLYNNRPVDVMVEEFDPDIILISGTESAISNFESDALITQIEALVMQHNVADAPRLAQTFEIISELESGTLDFDKVDQACEAGYSSGLEFVASNGDKLPVEGSTQSISAKRNAFLSTLSAFDVSETQVSGLGKHQQVYAEGLLRFAKKKAIAEALKKRVFFLEANAFIGRVFPRAKLNDEAFTVQIDAVEERSLKFTVGGGASSQPLSMGHAALEYAHFGRIPKVAKLSGSLGTLYSDLGLGIAFHHAGKLPWIAEPLFAIRRWNYTRDLVGFLQEIRPTFFNSSELEWGGRFTFPSGTRSALRLSVLRIQSLDRTYSNWLFSSSDPLNEDRFMGSVIGLNWSHKGLNHRQYPTAGSRFQIGGQFHRGHYASLFTPEDALDTRDSINKDLRFFRGLAQFEAYVPITEKFVFGVKAEGRMSSETLRSTHRGSLAQAASYSPMPGSKAVFLEHFRGYNFGAVAAVLDWTVLHGIHLRSEIHLFKATEGIVSGAKGPRLDSAVPSFWMGGFHAWKELPIGPISAGIEYYKSERSPLFFEVLLGYRLFQSSARR